MNKLKYVRLKKYSQDRSQPSEFELVDTRGRTVPLTLLWDDLPMMASWLGFGDADDIRQHIEHLDAFEGCAILENKDADFGDEEE